MDKREKIISLFGRYDNGKFFAKNRFLRSATWLAGSDEKNGAMSFAEISRTAEVAAGGAGTVITGAAYVSADGKFGIRQWGLHDDSRIEDVRKLSEAAHRQDSKLIVQLAHSGGQRDGSIIDGTAIIAPSETVHQGRTYSSKAMTKDDIKRVIADFVSAALRAKSGGADGVEIHGGHGFLFTQFLSPITNMRTDRYGGTLENRARILREAVREVKKAVGDNFPVWAKISISEGIEKGYGEEDGLAAAKLLLDDGIDGIEVSNGTIYSDALHMPSLVGVSAGESEAPSMEYAACLKKYAAPGQVIILTGGIRSLSSMADLIFEDKCDLLGMSRPFNAEPDLINRWAEEDSRPSACLSCNACFNTAAKGIIDCPIIRDRNEGFWDPL